MAVAFTEQSSSELSKLQPLWHQSAPQAVTEAFATMGVLGGWPAWQAYLADRKRPAPPFLQGKQPALLWGWPAEWQRGELESAIAPPAGVQTLALRYMLSNVEADEAAANSDLSFALQIVAMAYGLPRLVTQLPPETWWGLVERLHDLANEAQQHRVDWPGDPADVVRQQLLAAELPLALAYLFSEVRALRALRKPARAAFSEALVELTDGEGLPHARLLAVLGPLFACWTRARWLGARLKRGPWSRKAEYQYQWLVRNAIRLADRSGRFLLTSPSSSAPAWTMDLFKTALELAGDEGDAAAASAALPRGVVPKRFKLGDNDRPNPSLNSDWSGVAVLAAGWSPTDVRVALSYAAIPLEIELDVDGQRLFAGNWSCETTCDGELVRAVGEWERLCWESGKRYDYLELGRELSHGLRLERQLLLGRKDKVLYLADIVLASDGMPRRIRHTSRLPLGERLAWQPENETRDALLVGGKVRAALLPLALREWRADPRSGELTEEQGRIALTQEAQGRALCCPLFVDLDRKRAKKERSWRQLTIGESLEIVPADVAVGFRAQSGRDQWLFYRSLGAPGNRTVLGQNLAGEFSAGPFLSSGKYKEWIEIEAV